ncbi:MAG: rRNA maturation RNase YbeY [Acidiferrobacterales bacterium]
MKLRISVQYAYAGVDVPEKTSIAKWARAALKGHSIEQVELVVRIVDETESAALNHQYRQKTGPTNVLSFSYETPVSQEIADPVLLGDIVICGPVVVREARSQGKEVAAHWAHMVIHGIMHLRGYDHIHDTDAKIMEELESRVVRRLGFPDPYD